ncbi:MAG: L,D-transpeptidase family protein, partial [bacterium]
MKRLVPTCLLLLVAVTPGCGRPAELAVRLVDGDRVEVRLDSAAGVREIWLCRSTAALDPDPDTMRLPVTVRRWDAPAPRASVDSTAAHNVRYHYRARIVPRVGIAYWTEPESVDIPDVAPGTQAATLLAVSKLDYTLSVMSGERVLKRYPVALGRAPRRRKLHQDNASTPEGIYRVAGMQPQATFYKALDIDYPNAADRTRYEFCRDSGLVRGTPGIGGEIQVHGRGIASNWTFGCIALRDSDMDELFAWPGIRAGLPVYITGSELSWLDIRSILKPLTPDWIRWCQRELERMGFYAGPIDGVYGPAVRHALCALQHHHGKPITA